MKLNAVRNSMLAVAAVCCFAVPAASFAQTTSSAQQQTAAAKKGKKVKFTLKNPTNQTVNLKSGDEAITLAPGESKQMKVPAGTKIVTADATDTTPSGSVVTEVSDGMSGATVNLRQ